MSQDSTPTRIFDILVFILILAITLVQAYSDVAVSLLAPPTSDGRTIGELLTTPVQALTGILLLASAIALVWAWRQRGEAAAGEEPLREPGRGAPLGAAALVSFGVLLIGSIAGAAFSLGASGGLLPALEAADGARVALDEENPPEDAPPMERSVHAPGSILLEPAPGLTVNGAPLERPRLLAPGDVVRFKDRRWTARPPSVAPRQLLLSGLISVFTSALLLLTLAAVAFPGMAALGLGRTPIWPEVKRGVLGYLAFLPVLAMAAIGANIACSAFGLNPVPHQLQGLLQDAGPTAWGLAIASACVAAPLWEELLFRGLLLGALARLVSARAALALSAALFAVAHVGLPSVLPLFVFGLFLAYLTAKSPRASIIAAVVAHALHNILTMALFILTLP